MRGTLRFVADSCSLQKALLVSFVLANTQLLLQGFVARAAWTAIVNGERLKKYYHW
jgi:hypothetical protein